MKIRNGFVSNSSSSSFVVFYNDAELKDIYQDDVWVLGDYLNEGRDCFKPSKEIKDLIVAYLHDLTTDIELVHIYKFLDDEGGTEFSKNELMKILPDKFKVESFEKDYYSNSDVSDFKMQYLGKRGY